MSASVTRISDAKVVSSADAAHRRLTAALATVERDYWAVADAVHEARVSEAWLRDARAHEARYRQIMADRKLPSIFDAYCVDEFGIGSGAVDRADLAGRLRAAIRTASRDAVVDWSRFTVKALGPVTAAIIATYDAADVAAALVAAQRLSSKAAAEHPRPGHQGREEQAQVRPGHVRAALIDAGITAQRDLLAGEHAASQRRRLKLFRAVKSAETNLAFLISERQRREATDIIVSAIRRLADDPASLATIRAALDDAT